MIDIRDHGALGSPNDDTDAIKSAVDAADMSGTTLVYFAGDFTFDPTFLSERQGGPSLTLVVDGGVVKVS